MTLIACGINHSTAPVDIREKVCFGNEIMPDALNELKHQNGVYEAAILSTCNRTEIYCNIDQGKNHALIDWLHNYHGMKKDLLKPFLYEHPDKNAVRHVLRVASGLDSMILGETQVLGQLKNAYQDAINAGCIGHQLNRLFQHSFHVAKEIRSNTAIGNHPVSIAYAAVKLAQQIFGDLQNKTALLIGAGEMIELSAQHLSKRGVKDMIFANRTLENAQPIAIKHNAEAITLKSLSENLHRADIVITSTAAPIPIIGKGLIETVLHQRKHQPMLLIDLAIPRDIEPEANQLEDVFLYTVDDLQQIANSNLEERLKEKVIAEKIIQISSVDFLEWVNNIPNEEVIKNYRRQANLLKDELLQIALRKLKSGSSPDLVVEELADKLTNKLLHQSQENIKNPTKSKETKENLVGKDTKKHTKIGN